MKKFLTALFCLATLFSLVFAGTAFAETGCYFCDNGKDCERHCIACPSDPTGKCPAHCYFCKNGLDCQKHCADCKAQGQTCVLHCYFCKTSLACSRHGEGGDHEEPPVIDPVEPENSVEAVSYPPVVLRGPVTETIEDGETPLVSEPEMEEFEEEEVPMAATPEVEETEEEPLEEEDADVIAVPKTGEGKTFPILLALSALGVAVLLAAVRKVRA